MRAVRTAGIGVGLAIASGAWAADAPRARLRLATVPPVQRGQMPEAAPAPPPGSTPLGPPRDVGNPSVTVSPGIPAMPPTVTPPPVGGPPMYVQPGLPPQGLPTYGIPIEGQPSMPVPGQPLPNYGLQLAPGPGVPMAPAGLPAGAVPIGPPRMLNQPQMVPGRPILNAATAVTALPYGIASGLLAGPGGGRFSVTAESLLWWVQAPRVPVLVNTSSPQFSGITGLGDTRSLFGGDTLSSSAHSGGRFGAAYWLDPERSLAIDGNIFFLTANAKEYGTSTRQDALIARPFINVNTAMPFSQLVAAPGLSTGGILVRPETSVWGAEVNFRTPLVACDACRTFELFAGFRYFHLDDQITITESFVRTPDSPQSIGVPNAISGQVRDQFRTENDFYGFNMGFQGERRRGNWFLGYKASIALGTVFQSAEANGGQLIQTTAGPVAASGGLLALQGANIGRRTQSEFGALPEAGLKIGYYVTPRLKLSVGYNFLYLNSVLRAGDQIDPFLDVNRIPNFPLPAGATPTANTTRPILPLRTTDVFVQGVSFGLQYVW